VLRIDLDRGLEDFAQRVAQERLGVTLPYLRQQCAVGSRDRDPRADWSLSLVYRALLQHQSFNPVPGKRVDELRWFAVDALDKAAPIGFDHQDVIGMAVSAMREEVDDLDLPFDYLPPEFTLGELQATCEALLGKNLDKSSFRRRLRDRDTVEPIEGAFVGGANRPAQMYRASKHKVAG
jgi:8-oxo-dGTP diphosphatase